MKQLRITKRHRPGGWRQEPLPLDPRDPDIVRAKELARRSRAVALAPRPGGSKPGPEGRSRLLAAGQVP